MPYAAIDKEYWTNWFLKGTFLKGWSKDIVSGADTNSKTNPYLGTPYIADLFILAQEVLEDESDIKKR